MARLLREPRRALHARIAETLESQFPEIAESQPELLARHCTEAGLIEKAAGLGARRDSGRWNARRWSKPPSSSLAPSTRSRPCPQVPRCVAKQIKLQVALITRSSHVKGYAAPETKAAAERARLLIEQAEALGEPPEDPLLLFSVLYGFWVANYVAFNGDVMRELAAQFLALAEKQGTTVPRHGWASPHGYFAAMHGRFGAQAARISIERSRFTILPSIARWRRDSAKTSG